MTDATLLPPSNPIVSHANPADDQPEILAPNCAAPRESVGQWAAFVAAAQFLTRIPLPTKSPVSTAALQRCPIYFPLVGGLIGAVYATLLIMACLFWPVWLAVIVAMAIEARLTGAFHEDAVADFCDAFGGGWTRDDVLRILKDSRIGTYGALGIGLAVALRAGASIETITQIGRVNWVSWSAALIASSAIGRWMIVLVMVCVPPVPSRESLSHAVGNQLKRADLLTASFWSLPVVLPFVVLSPLRAMISSGALALIAIWFMRLVKRRLGGITGDCLGCIGYLSQVIVLLVTSARWEQ